MGPGVFRLSEFSSHRSPGSRPIVAPSPARLWRYHSAPHEKGYTKVNLWLESQYDGSGPNGLPPASQNRRAQSRLFDCSPSPAQPTATISPFCLDIPLRVELHWPSSLRIPQPWRSDGIVAREGGLCPPQKVTGTPPPEPHQFETLLRDRWSLPRRRS